MYVPYTKSNNILEGSKNLIDLLQLKYSVNIINMIAGIISIARLLLSLSIPSQTNKTAIAIPIIKIRILFQFCFMKLINCFLRFIIHFIRSTGLSTFFVSDVSITRMNDSLFLLSCIALPQCIQNAESASICLPQCLQ